MNRILRFFNAFLLIWSSSQAAKYLAVVSGLLAAIGGMLIPAGVIQSQESVLNLERIRSATVFIMQTSNVGANLIVHCVGSGTLVSRTGLILTNAHNTETSSDCPGDTLVIALTLRPDEPPVPKYRAEILQANSGLDLALLSITQELDGRLIEANTLALPFVELADSSEVALDDTITVVGYPGIGDDPAAVERGTVSGFVFEPSAEFASWIQTSAAIRGTMSGGGAYNRFGQLIGIPTTAPVTRQTLNPTCYPIQDTNEDGQVNRSDSCIPIGGFINSLRPSNFARSLLRGASLGLRVDLLSQPASPLSQQTGVPIFKGLFFSPAVVDGMPTTVISSLPAGRDSLYLFFDYENFTSNNIYELRVTIDGIPAPTFSLPPVRWSGGRSGLWYIGVSGQILPNGVYEFTLVVDGVAIEAKRLIVGTQDVEAPTFGNIVFGLLDSRGSILGNAYVLPTGNIASARFIYRNMQDGMEWTEIWYYEGREQRRNTDIWRDGIQGAKNISIEDPQGLPSGRYRLALYIDSNLAALSDFTIAGSQEGVFPQVFVNAGFINATVPSAVVSAAPATNFASGVQTLFTRFNWQQILRGTLWTMRWSVDDSIFFEQTSPWNNPDSGQNFITQLVGSDGIPDGTYKMDLLINNVQLVSVTAQVGIGQLPIDRFAQASGVRLLGTIRDADTQQGIPGVSFVLISPDYSIEDFTWDAQQIYAIAKTDQYGRFQVDRLLQYDALYSVFIIADGYLPITGDGYAVTTADPNPLDIVIELYRG